MENFYLENNPLRIHTRKGFQAAPTNQTYFIGGLQYFGEDDFIDFANKRILDSSYTITFHSRVGEVVDENFEQNVYRALELLNSYYPDVQFNYMFCCANKFYSSDEFKRLLNIKEVLRNRYNPDYDLQFTADNMVFSEKEILTANSKISEIVETIKRENLSPLESVLYVHRLLSEREYYMEQDSHRNRDIYSILNQKNIICTGFSNLMYAVFEELNDPRIKVKVASISMQGNRSFIHSINNVYICDEKYNCEGYYNLDICANAEANNIEGLLGFMTPLLDVEHSYTQTTYSRHFALETHQGNVGLQTIPMSKNNEQYYSVFNSLNNSRVPYRRNTLQATQQFLDTPMGNRIREKLQEREHFSDDFEAQEILCLKTINGIIDETVPISLDAIEQAYTVVAEKFIKPTDLTPVEYAHAVVSQAVETAPTFYDVEKCTNCFAREYLLSKDRAEEE